MPTADTRIPPPLISDDPTAPPHVAHSVLPIGKLTILLPLQLFLAAGWFRAGVEKVIDPAWWTGDHLVRFLEEQGAHMLALFGPFADHVLEPAAPLVSWFVVLAQLAIAICLITNRHTKQALWAGIVLNLCFTMAGRVNPSAFYLVMQMTLLFALSRPVGSEIARRRAAFWLIPAAVFAPFARTLRPAEVIDDPALMISFVAALTAVTTVAIAYPPAALLDAAASTDVGRWLVKRTGAQLPGGPSPSPPGAPPASPVDAESMA